MHDPFMTFWGWVVRFSFKVGWWTMGGVQHTLTKGSKVATRPQKQTGVQKREEDETRRVAGCREVVLFFLEHFGYIARECISREELGRKIDAGIQPEQLAQEIYRRIQEKPGIILGQQRYGEYSFDVKLPFSIRDRHAYIVGKSGSGKTNLLRNMILQDLTLGNGFGVIAPELELLTDEIMPYIPDDRIDDVVFVNPADASAPIPLNPLHLDVDDDLDQKVDDFVTIFKRVFGDTGIRMDQILSNALYALIERPGSTLNDIERLLSRENPTFRKEVIRTVDEQTRTFFAETYPSLDKTAHIPVITRISALVRRRAVSQLLCQPGRCFSFRKAMDEGKILLFNLADGMFGIQTSQLLGQLIVSKINLAVMSRMDTPAAARRPFFLYLDEFQTFTGVAQTSYANILSRARKYKLGLILAHQQTGQLTNELMRDILGNVSTLLTFNVSHEDARKLSREYVLGQGEKVEYLKPEKLVTLGTGDAWGKIGRSSFLLHTHLAPQQPDYERAKEVIYRSRRNYGTGGKWDAEVQRPPRDGFKQLPPKEIDEPPDPTEVF